MARFPARRSRLFIGQHFGLVEMALAMATLLRKFRLYRIDHFAERGREILAETKGGLPDLDAADHSSNGFDPLSVGKR